ncbi:3-methyladenine DNA glycosylase [Microbacterium sp. CFBP9034]|uniref:3-methyladenine DNA glycosylase n=1 Tax=Microbacterium sp. CFBP9034 TaxID=3096540 RepID=UPI002A6B4BA4|nr:3-methyladenine DNA glycosylase [Microbacterium sp. CFBP9034]MDY0909632.1 3-methyladenine DNA glycosylase [Microbacterium sp. CFBP9034]
MPIAPPRPAVLSAAEWRAREEAHAARADEMTAAHRARASRGERHPVEDFLFTYYSYKPALLRRWHPGAGRELADAAATPRAQWRWYASGDAPGSLVVDAIAMRQDRGALITNIGRILRATANRTGSFGCFGLHEWAMVYREPGHRHEVPLRLGQTATDAVVEAHDLRCTHFDAFRFFTPEAAPLNRDEPSRERQADLEQPGCLHAGMDLYKWAMKLGPLVPGELLLDAFALARDIRTLDMRASPYDLTAWGYDPVPIETAQGKAEYVAAQRVFAERGRALRAGLLDVIDAD